jgi:hypothetical protein
MKSVMATRATRSRATTPITAVLLLVQVLAGGAVPLAHAGEHETAPVAIEAHHDASCVMIHDAIRCALCLYVTSLTTPPPGPRVGLRTSAAARPAPLAAELGMGSPTYVASRPRAPPSHLS